MTSNHCRASYGLLVVLSQSWHGPLKTATACVVTFLLLSVWLIASNSFSDTTREILPFLWVLRAKETFISDVVRLVEDHATRCDETLASVDW